MKANDDAKKLSRRERVRRRRLYMRWIRNKEKIPKPLFVILLPVFILIELIRRLMKFLMFLTAVVVVAGCVFLYLFVYPKYKEFDEYARSVAMSSKVEDFDISSSSRIYDVDGNVIGVVYEDANTKYIPYEEIPIAVQNAFVAVEDQTFWDNSGFDPRGITRVIYEAIRTKGKTLQGASTLTQQLVKNVYLTSEKKIDRKINEIFISYYMSNIYTKEQIMEFYCNDVCFANGIYGIWGASRAYFNKDIGDCTLSEIAYLCAIPNRPEYYNPYKDPSTAIPRRDKILGDMLEQGYITQQQYNIAIKEKIKITPASYPFNDYQVSYAIDCAVRYLMECDGFVFEYEFHTDDAYDDYHSRYNAEYEKMRHKLYTGGYDIYTSLDINVYDMAQEKLDNVLAFSEGTNEDTGLYQLQGALTIVDNYTRKVVAVVGGRSQEQTAGIYSFNRAWQSYRQPGSSIKPLIVYTPALEHGYSPNSIVFNINVSHAKQKGVNVQELSGDPMSLRSAVEQSKNGVAWQVFDKLTPNVGMSYVINMRYGGLCKDDFYNASALGGLTYGVTTVEQAEAYSTLANHGYYQEATCLVKMLDRDGSNIYADSEEVKVYNARSSDNMVDILRGVLTRGTAAGLGWYGSTKTEAFGKTGTTNQSKDGWFCGATPYYSIAVWVGYDKPKTLSNLYGATYPGRIWKECMLSLISDLPTAGFEFDKDLYVNDTEYHPASYYTYLEGRDDDEELSDGYTVANYREDRVIGEGVYDIIHMLEYADSGDIEYINSLYSRGCMTISTILSRNYSSELQTVLDSVYVSKLPAPEPEVVYEYDDDDDDD